MNLNYASCSDPNMFDFKDKCILLISPEPWNHIFVSKHHYAVHLAKRGNRVLFLNPPDGTNSIVAIDDSLFVVNFKPLFRGINRLPSFVRKLVNRWEIARLCKFLDINKLDVVWSFDPFRYQYLSDFGASYTIYHPVDIHQTKLTRLIADEVDVIFASSDQILGDYSEIETPKFKINHGLASHFLFPDTGETKAEGKIQIGYVGNLNYNYLDTNILERIVKENPAIEFHFIGPYSLGSDAFGVEFIRFLQSQKNVILLGKLSSEEVAERLFTLDGFVLCYMGDGYIRELANPHKLLEYLSTGKVVVSHYIDEYSHEAGLIEMARRNEEIPELFKMVVKDLDEYNSEEKRILRVTFARNNTYDKHIDRISCILSNLKNKSE